MRGKYARKKLPNPPAPPPRPAEGGETPSGWVVAAVLVVVPLVAWLLYVLWSMLRATFQLLTLGVSCQGRRCSSWDQTPASAFLQVLLGVIVVAVLVGVVWLFVRAWWRQRRTMI